MPTWKFTTKVRDSKGRRGEYYGEVDAPDEGAARTAVTNEVLKDGHTCGPVKLKSKRQRR